ncbi:MAG: tetratricopeptide repeat protein, partial [Pseudomonadota bacterium]
AISQYLRLAEQDPDLLEAQIELTRLTLEFDAWEEAERHGRAAQELAPEDRDVIFLNSILDYRAALLAGDTQAAAEAAKIARARSEEEPDNPLAWRLLINHAMTRGDLDQALVDIDTALAHLPKAYDFYLFKLQVLNQRTDLEGLENTLKTALTQFPRDPQMRASLLSLYMGQDNLEAAEAFLREQAAAPEADMDEKLQVVEFLRRTKGNDSAKDELDQLIVDHPEERVFQATRAALDYEIGETETAIGKMRTLLDGADPSEETSSLKVMLARMLVSSGNVAEAKTQVEEALTDTPGHVAALKMRASWQIEDDKPEDAILTLRTAQAGAPRDPDLMTLMGQAHERAGAYELAGERYALAVEASGQAPAETLRYVDYLLGHDKIDTAEASLDDALRVSPTHITLITRMADIQVQKQNWDQVTRLVWRLRSIDTPASIAEADRIQATLLLGQQRTEEAITFLEELSESNEASNAVLARLIATLVREGKVDEARTLLNERLLEEPENPDLRFIQAELYEIENNLSEAENIYRELLAVSPAAPGPLRQALRILVQQNRQEEAREILETAITAAPQDSFPQVLLAGHQEHIGDIDGAIATYQALYEVDSGNLVVVNNLASLITTHRTDEDSLSRAYTIARRLRSSDIAAFQDTYG